MKRVKSVRRSVVAHAFRALWAGTASSNLADGMLAAAAPLFAYGLTHDPVLVSGVLVAQRLPWFVFTLFSGVLVDRVPHRALLAVANLLRAGALAGLAVALAADVRHIGLLYAALFVLGTAETVIDTAALAILPSLVSRDRLDDANGRIYATQSVAQELLGPPLGAALFAATAVAAFASGSVAFALAGLLMLALPRRRAAGGARPQRPGQRRGVWAEIGQGLRWFWRDPLIRAAAVLAAVSNLFSSMMGAVFVIYAKGPLGLSDAQFGLLLTAEAVGGIGAGLVTGTLVRRLGGGPAVVLSTLMPAVAYAVIALTSTTWLVAVALTVQAAAATIGNVVFISLRQSAVPTELIGRVTSAYRLLALGAVPVGAALAGVLAGLLGIRAPFVLGAAVMALAAVVAGRVFTTEALEAARSRPATPDTDTDTDTTGVLS